jgi:hypothetical protein
MDDLVKAALKKWPNVPDCRGWLALDARGQWYMRDERTQAAGPFPQVKGSRIQHEKLLAFIHRNYESDGQGAWYFQNGPQRVYVELEAAPWVWRLQAVEAQAGEKGATADAPDSLLALSSPAIVSHTGANAAFQAAWLDEFGRLFLTTDLGLGLVHSLDMACAADAVEQGVWQPQEVIFAELVARHGLCLSPASMASTRPSTGA